MFFLLFNSKVIKIHTRLEWDYISNKIISDTNARWQVRLASHLVNQSEASEINNGETWSDLQLLI